MSDILKELREYSVRVDELDWHPSICDEAANEIERLRAVLEVAYDGLLNYHLHDDQTRDDYTNKVGAALDDNARRRVAFGDA